jgi:hypothetical protein
MDEQFIDRYDEREAVAFILNFLPVELKGKFTEDDICYILDASEDYYAQSNFFETDDETEERELIEYIIRKMNKDMAGKFTGEDILFVVRGADAYFESIYGEES